MRHKESVTTERPTLSHFPFLPPLLVHRFLCNGTQSSHSEVESVSPLPASRLALGLASTSRMCRRAAMGGFQDRSLKRETGFRLCPLGMPRLMWKEAGQAKWRVSCCISHPDAERESRCPS